MDIIVALNQAADLDILKHSGVTHVMIGDACFSGCPAGLDQKELFEAVKRIKEHDLKVVARVDCLYQQSRLADLTTYLQQLAAHQVDGIFYSDIAVKVLIDQYDLPFESIYGPETLLTNQYDVAVLQQDGVDGCVISKDISLEDVYAIAQANPGYCYLRVFGPLLISYSARRFISVYTSQSKEYTRDYYLKEETRDTPLPIVEKESGTWLYGCCLQAVNCLPEIVSQPFKGIIIDNILFDDEYIVDVCCIYKDLLDAKLQPAAALEKLQASEKNVEFVGIEEIKETGLDKG